MRRIMIADDEAPVRKALRLLIPWNELGCQVVSECKNGAEVLRKIETDLPDILVMDIRMPMVDGLDVAHQLRQNGCSTAVIFLTAYADFEYARKALQYQAQEYIIKTDMLDELPKAIRKVCDRLDRENRSSQWELQALLREGMLSGFDESTLSSESERLLRELSSKRFRLLLIRNSRPGLQALIGRLFSREDPLWIPVSEQCTGVLFSGQLPNRRELEEGCRNLCSMCCSLYGHTVLCCAGEEFTGINGLGDSYEACRSYSESFFSDEHPALLLTEDRHCGSRLPGDLLGLTDTLLTHIRRTDSESALEQLEKLVQACRQEHMQTVKSIGNLLLTECFRLIMELIPEMPKTFTDPVLQDEIYHCSSLPQFRTLM